MKINTIVAAKAASQKEWGVVCAELNGSRFQGSSVVRKRRQMEERFLVKWNGLSFLHCTWETERDLVRHCEGAKGRLSTFRRKAKDGLLYTDDERLGGVSLCLLCYHPITDISCVRPKRNRNTLIHHCLQLSAF